MGGLHCICKINGFFYLLPPPFCQFPASLLTKSATSNYSIKPVKHLYRYHHSYRNDNSSKVVACDDGGVKLRSADLVAMEYADLKLTDRISAEVGHVRIRQHVNPLSSSFSVPAEIPDWNNIFKDPTLPLMVDIGSGSGRFLIWLAKKKPDLGNYLGLEIRKKLVKRADFWVKELTLGNIHFLFANATVSFRQLVLSYPGPLMTVSILCPDPHFKKRHHKRRVLQTPLLILSSVSWPLEGRYSCSLMC
ncbi:hypothetical protein K2173_025573 [Erythroxylum novogranatense]|uniref:tRNA (guanine(46)-N(7))-methyltransferase n=1 Tax=Erythroxylum novogranatense TaxID=1862640 RepID=A0AAV8TAG7_9ROSI|nr:hypothetical protein K2173_025573 [Erythroxylum novogranatense]